MTETASNNTEKMPVSDTNYSRIAKNTVFLFFRMILTMGIGLYTSRVLLNALGVEDYGIYNIVGGFVAMFAIVSGALTSAISRFITFELGRGDSEAIHKTFQCSVTVMVGISAIVIIIGETIGLWLLYNKLVIPEARLDAAFWVFQFAIATFVLNLLSTPYNACIISHEKMQAFAYISIFEAVSKLLICFAIIHSPFDRLVFYAVLLCLVGIIIRVIYVIYSKKNFTECRGHMIFDKKIVKSIFHRMEFHRLFGVDIKRSGGHNPPQSVRRTGSQRRKCHRSKSQRHSLRICQLFHHGRQSADNQELCQRQLSRA